MLYLSPSCGAAGIFLAGTGLGASISSPATQTAAACQGGLLALAAPQARLTDGADLGVAGGVGFRLALFFLVIAIFVLHIGNFALLFLAFLF